MARGDREVSVLMGIGGFLIGVLFGAFVLEPPEWKFALKERGLVEHDRDTGKLVWKDTRSPVRSFLHPHGNALAKKESMP